MGTSPRRERRDAPAATPRAQRTRARPPPYTFRLDGVSPRRLSTPPAEAEGGADENVLHQERKPRQVRGFLTSGRRDLNSGPLVPQTSALTRLRHAPSSPLYRLGVEPVAPHGLSRSGSWPFAG